MRIRRSRKDARLYILLLIVFTRFTFPSTIPELHCRVRAAVTALRSWRRKQAKLRTGPGASCSVLREAARGFAADVAAGTVPAPEHTF